MTVSAADLEKSEEELLLDLANQLIAGGTIRYSGPMDDESLRDRARRWMDSTLASLRGSICKDPRVIAYLRNPGTQNLAEITGIVVDVLVASSIGVPAATLALLVVKGRLQNLCG